MQIRIMLILVLALSCLGGDVSVIITEKTVNDFIDQIGVVQGKGKSKGINYTWKVKKAAFDFEPGAASFKATVDLDAGVLKLSDKVTSKVNVSYDSKTNKISMEVEEAIFKIYIKVLGKKAKVGQVDIAKYYRPKFEFNGPQPIQKTILMEIGKGQTREISVAMTNEELRIEKDQVKVTTDLIYSGKDL